MPVSPSPPLSSRAAVGATVTFFAYNGLVIGVWAGSLPSLRDRVGMDSTGVALLLVVTGLAAIASMQVGGRLSDRHGARPVAVAMVPVLAVGILAVGLAPTYPALLASGVVLGLGNGGIDVAMNALGVHVERSRPRPIMSFFHGMWSVGNLVGALLVLTAATLAGESGRPWVVLSAAALAAATGGIAFLAVYRLTPTTPRVDHVDADGVRTPIPASAYLLGLMAIAFGLGEGTAADWSGLLVADVTGVDAGRASMAVVAVSASMVVIRLLGDGLVARFGRRAIVRFGGTASAAGYLVTAFASDLTLLLIGWSLVGLGIGMIAPQVYATAGHAGGGRGLAVVVTFGYATFLAGPALIGLLVHAVGIQTAMVVPGVLLLGLIALARIMPRREDELLERVRTPA